MRALGSFVHRLKTDKSTQVAVGAAIGITAGLAGQLLRKDGKNGLPKGTVQPPNKVDNSEMRPKE